MIEKKIINHSIKMLRLEQYMKKELERAGFIRMKVSKTPLVTRIILNVAKPGLAIGKKGKTIRNLTFDIEKKFKMQNPQIEIQEIKNPVLNAKSQADKIKMLLERGYSWRSIAYKTVDEIMENGAQGVELILKGKLSGKGGRKRKERIAKGYMKKAGAMSEQIEYAKATAYPKAGAIGIKIRIVQPETIFPDKLNVKDYLLKKSAEKIENQQETKETKPEQKKTKKEKTETKKTKQNTKKTQKKVVRKKNEKKQKKAGRKKKWRYQK